MLRYVLFITSFMLILIGISPFVSAEEEEAGQPFPIHIEQAYSFATVPGATNGAVFMTLKNESKEDDRLISANTEIAKITEIHENFIDEDDGTMMMRKIKGVDIPAGETAKLQPKGYHIMLIKLTEPLTLGENIQVTLTFEKAGETMVNAEIVNPGKDMSHEHHH